ncbi:MAG: ABC transporter permease [Clostridiales bacterium]
MKTNIIILLKSPKFIIGLLIIMIITGFILSYPIINKASPIEMVGMSFEEPSSKHILGTDNFGADVLLKLAYGTRTSVYIGLLAGIFATILGLIIGLFSGYLGGIIDNILNSLTNIFIVIPPIIVLILISVSLEKRSTLIIAIIIGVTSWPWTARAIRAQTSSLRHRDHVNIAKISGYTTPKIILFEILPYIASYVFMAFIIQTAAGILSEAAISMLGLAPENSITLGLMLNWALAFDAINVEAWWAFLPPTAIITFLTLSLYLMNAGMDEIFNPKIRS